MAKTVDVNLLNPFIQATTECLVQMAQARPQRKRIFIKTDPLMHGDIAGIIGMSNGVTGSCVVSFPDLLARRVVARMMMEEDGTKLAPEMINDGIGEIANMVAGGAKRLFSTLKTYKFDISTPTVVAGPPVKLFNPLDTVSIACEFSADPDWPETFLIELTVKPSEKPA